MNMHIVMANNFFIVQKIWYFLDTDSGNCLMMIVLTLTQWMGKYCSFPNNYLSMTFKTIIRNQFFGNLKALRIIRTYWKTVSSVQHAVSNLQPHNNSVLPVTKGLSLLLRSTDLFLILIILPLQMIIVCYSWKLNRLFTYL